MASWLKFQGPVVVQLQDGELLPLESVWLSVVHGRVWLTQAGDPDDHFIDSGQAIRLAAGCRALMSAEGPAQVSLMPAPSRWQLWRRKASQWLPSRRAARRPVNAWAPLPGR